MAPFVGCVHCTQYGTSRCRKREPSTPSMAQQWQLASGSVRQSFLNLPLVRASRSASLASPTASGWRATSASMLSPQLSRWIQKMNPSRDSCDRAVLRHQIVPCAPENRRLAVGQQNLYAPTQSLSLGRVPPRACNLRLRCRQAAPGNGCRALQVVSHRASACAGRALFRRTGAGAASWPTSGR